MKQSILVAAVVGLFSSPFAFADNQARDSFYQYAHTLNSPGATQVKGGNAQIDKALGIIIPMPYEILLDQSVPATLVLVWQDGDNWMEVLRKALAPIGLMAVPDWSKNNVTITWLPKPKENLLSAAMPAGTKLNPGKSLKGGFSSKERTGDTETKPSPMVGSFNSSTSSNDSHDSLKIGGEFSEATTVSKPLFLHSSYRIEDENFVIVSNKVAEGYLAVITGYANKAGEKNRIKAANASAYRVAKKMERYGIPKEGYRINKRTSYPALNDKAHIDIRFVRSL